MKTHWRIRISFNAWQWWMGISFYPSKKYKWYQYFDAYIQPVPMVLITILKWVEE